METEKPIAPDTGKAATPKTDKTAACEVGQTLLRAAGGSSPCDADRTVSRDVEQILSQLIATRVPYVQADLPSLPGVYTIYLSPQVSLPPFADAGGLLYVGKSESNLRTRDVGQHFRPGATSRSTLRRSLGAILRKESGFRAIPRGSMATKNDVSHYKFRLEDEEALTAWMKANLDIGYVAVKGTGVTEIEDSILEVLIPPLNIDGRSARRNPHAATLLALRAACADEAMRT